MEIPGKCSWIRRAEIGAPKSIVAQFPSLWEHEKFPARGQKLGDTVCSGKEQPGCRFRLDFDPFLVSLLEIEASSNRCAPFSIVSILATMKYRDALVCQAMRIVVGRTADSIREVRL